MNNNVTFTDKRLLEALDYIDESFIAEVTEDYKVYPTADEYIGDKKPHSKILRSLKYVAAVAACAVLMSTLIPVVQYVSGNLGDLFAGIFGPPSDTSELTEDSYKIPEEHIENAPYFIFSPDLEPISAEKMEEIRKAFYQMIYDFEYPIEYAYCTRSPLYANDKELAVKHSDLHAKDKAEEYTPVFFSTNTENHNISRYYGTVDGYVFLMLNTALVGEYNIIKLGDVTISNPTSFYIYGYKDGKLTTIEELYDKSKISASTVAVIAKRHDEFNSAWKDPEMSVVEYYYPKFTPDLEILSEEQLNEIGNYFYNEAMNVPLYNYLYYELIECYGEEHSRIFKERIMGGISNDAETQRNKYFNKENEAFNRYYGAFGDSVVLVNVSMMHAITQFELAGYNFYFPTATDINVYNNGRMISLIQAYNEGLLTDEDIGVIYKRHDLYEDYLKNRK